MAMVSTLACEMATITAVKSFIVQAYAGTGREKNAGENISKLAYQKSDKCKAYSIHLQTFCH
jgi:hypothetical protein